MTNELNIKNIEPIEIDETSIFNLALYYMIYNDYKGFTNQINQENHNNSGLFLFLGNLKSKYSQEQIEFDRFNSIKELRNILKSRLYYDKAIILDLKRNKLSQNITITNVHKDAISNFNKLFKEKFKRFGDIKKKYLLQNIGTKKEYALALHLATKTQIIIMSQTTITSTGTGSIYYFIKPGVYIKTYLKYIYTLPYSYYVYPEENVALVAELYAWEKKERKARMINKQIINWKDYFSELLNIF